MATLQIGNRKEFDQQVWQYETNFTTEQYQSCIKNFSDVLSRIYDMLDQNEDIDVDQADLYQLGDLINLLDNIKVDTEHTGIAWSTSRSDFDEIQGYVLDGIDEDEINEMIDEVDEYMGNDDDVADSFWMHLNAVADEHNLQKRTDIIKMAEMCRDDKYPDYRYAFCTICTKDDNERCDAIIALHEYDVDTDDDEQIYFYCGSKEEFVRICKEGADDFTICSINELTTGSLN